MKKHDCFAYQTAILHCPTGVYALVGHIPQYMTDLIFETEEIAQSALAEAQNALTLGHVEENAPFAQIWRATESTRTFRPGTFHKSKTFVSTEMIDQ